ncbi:putative membrane protein YfcA [Bacillus mesophilus]|uniref:Probable membrane transporter protein n=1 Tax=Bacillus mesophilus TaxID=1808955 RepID=A0A6M0Q6Z9_9BACI|nr:sulfite exporter TauE/SafE family protein [Bacillus mesophilus]MBM7661443.1 putative membrane protein YfcA [Bacillus mesophilus]NEY72114.1 sulfite exporter TauE/SafE family protein [Bacillus mesophilus]
MEWFILFIVGLVGGIIGSLMGLGGGVIVVPALLYLGSYGLIGDMTPQLAVGTSLVAVIATGLSSTLSYYKKGNVDIKSGLLFFIGSGPGGVFGSWVNGYLNATTFSLYFGLFIILISFLLFMQNRLSPITRSSNSNSLKKVYIDRDGTTYEYGYHLPLAVFISFVVGFTSGIFGIGGGALMVPAMLLLFRFPPHIAVATSMFMILLSSFTSSLTHLFLGNIDWLLTIMLVPGAYLGAKIGVYINTRLKPVTVVRLLRLFLFIFGLRMIIDGLL